MIISNGKNFITINKDGSIKILDKNYIDKENNLKEIEHKLKPLLENNSINYNDIPFNIQVKINKALKNIFEALEENEEGIFALAELNKFGLLKEKKNILNDARIKINSSLFKIGLHDLDKFYFKNKKAKLEFMETFHNNYYPKVNNSNIYKFVSYYKENNLNDFKLFHESLIDYGVRDKYEILKYYNDNIDSNFSLSTKEFGLISLLKRDLINLQNKVIEDAIEEGLDVPIDLPRFVSPTDKIKDEKIDLEKIKAIHKIDYQNKDSLYFQNNKPVKELKEKFIEELKIQQKIIDVDTNDNIRLIQLQLLNNGGYNFQRMREWACNMDNTLLSPYRMMCISQSSIKYCNKLVECGILKTDNFEDFYFSCPKTREILLLNPNSTFEELSNLVLKEFNVSIKEETPKNKKMVREIEKKQKNDFFDFLNAQYDSFYKNNNIPLNEFIKEITKENSKERKRFNDLYPGMKENFIEIITEYEDIKKYTYDRTATIKFENTDIKEEINNLWDKARKDNLHFEVSENDSPEKLKLKENLTVNFINASCVKFNGIKLNSLNNWKQNMLKSNIVDESVVNAFIVKSISHAKDLVSIGILKTKDNENFYFTDNFSKQILFQNLTEDIDKLKELNLGVKVLKKDNKMNIKNKNCLDEYLNFNFHYDQSNNIEYVKEMANKENSLINEIKQNFIMDIKFREKVLSLINQENLKDNNLIKLSKILDTTEIKEEQNYNNQQEIV
ncbi:hypothetical protein [Aliarcobacter butzleri]|uniref:hypothetical protein n=1 Tax=Aliarcobacter butzleri TaxID=28197 RepID=UPI002B249A53|nr:hypothetical protein [Aliarcobacter butzleri]